MSAFSNSGLLLPPRCDAGAVFVFLVGVFGVPAWRLRSFRDGWRWYGGEFGETSEVLDGDGGFPEAKLGTARFFMHRLLPQTGALFAAIMAGKGSTMDFDEAWF